MEEFHKVRRLPPYVFEQVNRLKASARARGADIIDLGMGNPDLPTPKAIVDKLCEVVRDPRTHRYSSSRGIPELNCAEHLGNQQVVQHSSCRSSRSTK